MQRKIAMWPSNFVVVVESILLRIFGGKSFHSSEPAKHNN